jgi:ribosome-associated protein
VPVKKKASPLRAKTTKQAENGGLSTAKATRRTKPKAATGTRGNDAAAGKAHAAGATAARRASLKEVVISALDDMKALEIKVLDVRGLTDVADTMVIASGTSDRHVRSVAQKLVEKTKAAGFRPHGVEGQQDSDWVLIDLNEMIVHVMLPRVREFYGLEKLWDMTVTKRAARA